MVLRNGLDEFHADAVQVRLICTYKGLGTQIENLNEEGEVVSVKQLETRMLMILRGTLWSEMQKHSLCIDPRQLRN